MTDDRTKEGKAPNKALVLSGMNLKQKVRNAQALFYTIGFPIMFTVIFYFMFSTMKVGDPNRNAFDYGFPGMVIYATGLLCNSAAIFFANGKKNGMMERLDTMPVGRKNIFLGGLLAETWFVILQLVIMFVLGYGIMRVYFYDFNMMLVGLVIAVVFGIQSAGVGILLAAYAKSSEAANGFAMMYFMPAIFASGALVPFESPIVYFFPPYWAKQIFLQITVFGDDLGAMMKSSSLGTATEIGIPLWGGLLILIAMTVGFLALGIAIFQKKTSV
jgi:ABC-type transport system involved in multi-copper enzyme maturation permease subunit